MPVVIDISEDSIFARLVFQQNIFTAYHRGYMCGDQIDDHAFVSLFSANKVLARYQPHRITLSEHVHLVEKKEAPLSHMHIGFNQSIEFSKPIKAIIGTILALQKKMYPQYSAVKAKFGVDNPVCFSKFISDENAIRTKVENAWLKKKLSLGRHSKCFWAKANNQVVELDCEQISYDIPTLAEIDKYLVTVGEMVIALPRVDAFYDNGVADQISESTDCLSVSNSRGLDSIIATIIIFLMLLRMAAKTIVPAISRITPKF